MMVKLFRTHQDRLEAFKQTSELFENSNTVKIDPDRFCVEFTTISVFYKVVGEPLDEHGESLILRG